jgi:hypothetical protein
MPEPWTFSFSTVVNNGDLVPGTELLFNSYNQPSINAFGFVVFRARSQGGMGQPATGIFSRRLGETTPIVPIAVRGGPVPDPNNLDATFNEFPSFPRIGRNSDMVAFRGQSEPVWEYVVDPLSAEKTLRGETFDDTTEEETTRIGTSGVYSNPAGTLITGASQLGVLPDFSYYSVPGTDLSIRFDQFPGAPSPTGGIVAFKGNWTDEAGVGQTGVYARDLLADGGESPVVFIADSNTLIPGGSGVEFGSTAPPSAADGKVVFLGLDNEEAPTEGGIYLSYLNGDPSDLTTVVNLGGLSELVDDAGGLRQIEEILSFDGTSVAFWGAWGTETLTQLIACPADGNADRLAYCGELSENGEQGGIGEGYFLREIPVHQGIFVTNTVTMETELVVETGADFESFVFFNFSGRPPGVGEGGDEEGDLELARWRESAFMALDRFDLAFKAADLTLLTEEERDMLPLDDFTEDVYIESGQGIYYQGLVGSTPLFAVAESGMNGGLLDPEAEGLPIVSLGLERDGLRNGTLAFAASMAAEAAVSEEEVDTWAGIYATPVRSNPPGGGGGSGGPGDGGGDGGGSPSLPPPFNPGEEITAIVGDDGDNLIEGTPITNFISGRGGDDTILGAEGNDYLEGERGDDFISAGPGDDYVIGGDGADFLNGNEGNDGMFGGDGDDVIYGGKGNDFINGNAGNDFLRGDLGNDVVRGGNGNDTLNGNGGNDVLYGDLGADLFLLSMGNDIIADFRIGEGDTIGIVSGQTYSLAQSGADLLVRRDLGITTLANVSLAAFEAANPIILV